MARLTVYKENYIDSTIVSNRFIDEYMKDANDAQLKIYFYLIRMINANQPISVSGIADKFNHTEKDVIRALTYWEKQKLLDLEYDGNQNLTGIRLRDLNAPANTGAVSMPADVDSLAGLSTSAIASVLDTTSAYVTEDSKAVSAMEGSSVVTPADNTACITAAYFSGNKADNETTKIASASFTKPTYSLDELRSFKEREDTAELLFITESYIGKPLTPSEIKTILFFTDVLHFSNDLIDYLIQYCVDRGKKDFKYIERVAINWAEDGVTTPEQAQSFSSKYDKNVYTIMNELGRSSSPTTKEMEFINRWIKEYGFSTDIILEACERTVLATDKHRFEYAEGILSSWKRENVHHKADICKIDEVYKKKKRSTKPATNNKFNQFTQNDYDFDALERELLSN